MSWIEHAVRDVRHALQMISRMPGLAAVVIVSLGIGIGVNTAVFSWIQAVAIQPLPGVANSGSLFLVEPRTGTGAYPGVSWLEFGELQQGLHQIRETFAFRMAPCNVGPTSESERAYGLLVSGNYFSALHLQPALGRFVKPREAAHPGGEPVAVISYGFWQTHYGGAASALGRQIRVNDQPLTIIGVAPKTFQGTIIALDFDLWMPATLAPALFKGSRELQERNVRGYSVMARLRPGVTQPQAQAELDQAMSQLAHDHPETNTKVHGELLPIRGSPRGPQRFLTTSLLVLQGLMLLLLLTVCGNSANLMLARGSSRQREMVVRRALGAGTWRVTSLVLTENLVLAFFGTCVGVPIAIWSSSVLRAVQFMGAFPIRFQTGVDASSILFATSLGLASGLVFGIGPAIQLARVNAKISVQSSGITTASSGLRNAFMATEVSLALVVLIVAALFLQSFRDTREIDPGFRREGVLLAAYDLTGRNAEDATGLDFARRLLDRLRAMPNVRSAAIATSVPLDIHGLPNRSFTLEGRGRNAAVPDEALTDVVTPGYFATMGIPLRKGADFADLSDTNAPLQAIVNEEFVGRYIGSAEPIGRHIEMNGRRYVITGVARNSLYDSFGEPPTPAIYFSYRDWPSLTGEIHVLTRAGAELQLAPDVRQAVREIDQGLPIYDIRTLSDHIEKNLLFRRIPARMFVVLGPLLLVLTAVGIYAVVSYTVSHRTRVIGVCMALGATPGRITRQMIGETMRVILLGAIAGWVIGFAIAREVARRGSFDAPILLGVPAILLAVATIGCWVPALRASRVEPIVALRHE
ncbi:MAG: ABC transporter permease [Candidatus Acidiferrales bacterium]